MCILQLLSSTVINSTYSSEPAKVQRGSKYGGRILRGGGPNYHVTGPGHRHDMAAISTSQLRALLNDRNLRRFVVQARPTGRHLGTGSYGTVEEVCGGVHIQYHLRIHALSRHGQ